MDGLTGAQQATLRQICNTFVPALEPEIEDDPGLFRTSAEKHGIMPLVFDAVAASPPAQVAQLRQLLSALEKRVFSAFLIRRFKPFSDLPLPDRERVLRAMATSRLASLRRAFQALKRLSCFLYYSFDAKPENPVWRAIGFPPSQQPPARAPRLPLLQPDTDTLTCDVCIVGSGAGGGVIAAELAATGKHVIVLEAATPFQSGDFDQLELDGTRNMYLGHGILATRDLAVSIYGGAALGGGTTVNWQTCLRLPDDVRAEWADRSGCRFFAEDGYTQSLDVVSTRVHMGTSESAVNANNDVLRRGCEALGYTWKPTARNSHGCDLSQCGYCSFGCRHGGKQSTTVTFLRDAVATGNAEVIGSCTVERVNVERGAVTGVAATVRNGNATARALTVRATIVVMAAGGIESPAVLLRSGIVLPALGRNLFLHPTSAMLGLHEEPICAWAGPPQTVMCDQFANISGSYGCRFETAPTYPGMGAFALPWHGARAHRELMQAFARAAAIIVLTRDHAGGRVWVNRNGRTQIDYKVGPRELHYLRTGLAAVARIHAAAGAQAILGLHSAPMAWRRGESLDDYGAALERAPLADNASPVFSAHQMGTCRMGANADTAVCDEDGKVFGVRGLYIGDASAFPLSSGVNPMITIMALSHHTAQRLKQQG